MKDSTLQVFADRQHWGPGISVWIGERSPQGLLTVIRKITVETEPLGEGAVLGEPSMIVERDKFIALAKGLYAEAVRLGFIEPFKHDESGELQAVKAHLEDAQKVRNRFMDKQLGSVLTNRRAV
jgi:hypothetical protein